VMLKSVEFLSLDMVLLLKEQQVSQSINEPIAKCDHRLTRRDEQT
jgi:hypothetical protein